MTIQDYPDELDYVNGKLRNSIEFADGSFLGTFLRSCLRADAQNYEVIRPALLRFMEKYPVRKGDWE